MKRYEMIKSNEIFSDVIKNGHFKKNNCFVLYNKDNNVGFTKFGIAVSKKLGNAVTRNKVKRQVRMIITNNKNLFKNNSYYIIMIKRGILDLKYDEIELNLLNLLEREK